MDSGASTNSEASGSAQPVLASQLLETELGQHRIRQSLRPGSTGIKSLDSALPRILWTGGKVIGIVSVEGSLSLAASVIAQHLLDSVSTDKPSTLSKVSPSPHPTVFLLTPPRAPVLPEIHQILQTAHQQQPCVQDPLTLLSNASLLQYFDAAGLAEVLAEVSSSLHATTSQSRPGKSLDSHDQAPPPRKQLLYVSGLPSALVSSASGGRTRASLSSMNAFLATVLRSLRNLSRTFASLVVVLDLDIEVGFQRRGLGILRDSAFAYSGVNVGGMGREGQPQQHQQQPVANKVINMQEELRQTLSRMLVDGVDVLVAVHRPEQISTSQRETVGKGNSAVVVEVVKDRVGAGLGHWGVWESG